MTDVFRSDACQTSLRRGFTRKYKATTTNNEENLVATKNTKTTLKEHARAHTHTQVRAHTNKNKKLGRK